MVSHEQVFDTGLAPAELDPDRPRPFDTPWGSFALYQLDGEVLAVQSFCPHMLGPLFQGTRSGDEMSCPWHRWRYSLRTGERTYAPDDSDPGPPLEFCEVGLSERGTYELRPTGRGPKGEADATPDAKQS